MVIYKQQPLKVSLSIVFIAILIGIVSGANKPEWILVFAGITLFVLVIMYSTIRVELLVVTLLIALSLEILNEKMDSLSSFGQMRWPAYIFLTALLFILAFIKLQQTRNFNLRRLLPYLTYLLFFLFSILSAIKAVEPLLAVQVAVVHFTLISLAFIAMPILISTMMEFKRFIFISWLIFGAFTLASLLYWLIAPDMATDHQGRLKGIFFNPNYAASYAYITIVIAIAYIQTIRIYKYRFFAIAMALLSVFMILLTVSKGVWLSTFVMLLFVSIRQRKLRNILLPVLGSIVVFFLLFQLANLNIDKLLALRFNISTITIRVSLWQDAVDLWNNNFFLGIGRGMSELSGKFLNSANLGTRPHGLIFQLLAEVGILGTLSFIIFMLISFWQVSRRKLHLQIRRAMLVVDVNDLKLITWIEGAVLGYLVREFFENNLLAVGNSYNIFFWLVMGWLIVTPFHTLSD